MSPSAAASPVICSQRTPLFINARAGQRGLLLGLCICTCACDVEHVGVSPEPQLTVAGGSPQMTGGAFLLVLLLLSQVRACPKMDTLSRFGILVIAVLVQTK